MKDGTTLHRNGGYNDIFTSAVKEELQALASEIVLTSADSIAKINKEAL